LDDPNKQINENQSGIHEKNSWLEHRGRVSKIKNSPTPAFQHSRIYIQPPCILADDLREGIIRKMNLSLTKLYDFVPLPIPFMFH